MPRRLPLVGLRSPAPAAAVVRTAVSGAIGIADTADGTRAVSLATDLAAALEREGCATRLVLLAFDAAPALAPAVRARLEQAASGGVTGHAIGPMPPPIAALVPAPERELLDVLVGLPALTAYAPSLTLLAGADRDALGWPEPLRAMRGSFDVELGPARRGFAPALARALREHGFLPRG